jgi:glycosyltransferase involved in cell wall biosynthesis
VKVVQVQTQAEAAGAQRISDMVGAGLRERGHQVRTVFMYRKTSTYDADPFADFILKEAPRGLAGQITAAAGLARYLRKERPDAVISYQHYGNIFGTIGARLAGTRRIIANQNGAPSKRGVMGLLSTVDRMMGTIGLYQANVVNSAWTEAQFAAYPGAYKRRIRRIDHGVALPPARFDKAVARRAFGLPEDAWLAITTGRQNPSKNQIALVGALTILPNLKVAVAGVGPERERLVAFAADNGVLERLHLVGEVPYDRIHDFLKTGDVFVFPSTTETFGLSVVEAAIAGLPIVASDLSVLHEVLSTEDGDRAALFASSNDAAGIAEALAKIAADPGLASRLASAGRKLAGKYAPATMCAGYEALLG